MVKIHKYNYDEVSEYDVAEMLMELIVNNLETSKYETSHNVTTLLKQKKLQN